LNAFTEALYMPPVRVGLEVLEFETCASYMELEGDIEYHAGGYYDAFCRDVAHKDEAANDYYGCILT
jgi:hypothetical protein